MNFEDNLDITLKQGFYLVRINSLPTFMDNNFAVILGAEGKMYRGEGKSLNESLANALLRFAASDTRPSLKGQDAVKDFFEDLGLED